jgi:hypothetical protein
VRALLSAALQMGAVIALLGVFAFATVRGCVAETNKERAFQICLQTCDASPKVGTCVSVCWGRYKGSSYE